MIKKSILVIALLLIIGLVLIFALAPSKVDHAMNPIEAHEPYVVSEQAKQLHASLVIGDWHADSLLWNRDLGQYNEIGQLDLPRMKAGNVGLQMFTTVTKSPSGLNYDQNETDAADDITKLALIQRWPMSTWHSLSARALYQAEKLHQYEQQHADDLMIIKSRADLQQWQQRRLSQPKLIGGLIGTEGSHALDGKLGNVQVLYDAGFRMMSLQHFFDNKLGGSLHGTSQAGLSEFGRQVVAKINQLNIILDVSHSSEKTVADVLEISDKPLVVSHTGFKGHCDTARNISDQLMQKIAAKGGLIGVGYWDGAVCSPHPKDIAKAIHYGIELVGEDHVSLGSDFDGSVTTAMDTSELVAVTHYLLEAKLTEAQIRKVMGGNMALFLARYLP